MDCLYKEVFAGGFFVGAMIGLWGYLIYSILFAERSIKDN